MNIECETDKLTKSLIIAADFTRKYQKQIKVLSVGVYLLGPVTPTGWPWCLHRGCISYTPNLQSNDRPYVKTLDEIAEQDFKDICNPTELELDVFKMVYGIPWVFDFREEGKDRVNTVSEDGNE